MDAPIVMMTIIDPTEVDDQVHALETVTEFPTSFYGASLQFKHPSECKIKTVSDHLGTPEANKNLWFTYPTSSINNGVTMTSYVFLKSMNEKIEAQLGLGEKIAAVDSKDAAERLVLSHFFPDLYGNLRAFSRQQFRCLDCNMKHRRVPLSGKCTKCGGKLLLTVNKGGVKKYLKIAQGVVEKYQLPSYLKQRLVLLEKNINSVFEDETTKQFNIAEFM
jgi:DNA polymerase II large subunit